MRQSIIEKDARDILYRFTETVNNTNDKYTLVASWMSPEPGICVLIITLYHKVDNGIIANCQHKHTIHIDQIDRDSVEQAIKEFLFTFAMSPDGDFSFMEVYHSAK